MRDPIPNGFHGVPVGWVLEIFLQQVEELFLVAVPVQEAVLLWNVPILHGPIRVLQGPNVPVPILCLPVRVFQW